MPRVGLRVMGYGLWVMSHLFASAVLTLTLTLTLTLPLPLRRLSLTICGVGRGDRWYKVPCNSVITFEVIVQGLVVTGTERLAVGS